MSKENCGCDPGTEDGCGSLNCPRRSGPPWWQTPTSVSQTDGLVKHMVDRFLGWKLPTNFCPDGGIHFDADAAKKLDPRNARYEPNGTNLFDATQAEDMVRHMLEGLPEENAVGAAEAEVGRYVYRRIEALMDAKAGTPEAAELAYLARLAESVEEYGEEACAVHPVS